MSSSSCWFNRLRRHATFLCLFLGSIACCSATSAKSLLAFVPNTRTSTSISSSHVVRPYQPWLPQSSSSVSTSTTSTTSLNMFMGSDGGILGIGTPELLTILLVGYFILGPSDLYKLTKEIGKFIQNVRTLGTEATANFENTMESQLQLQELRKAQVELNNAFSFRRSINTNNDETDMMTSTAESTTAAAAAVATPATDTTTKKIRRRRRRKKIQEMPQELSIDRDATLERLEQIPRTLPDATTPLPPTYKEEDATAMPVSTLSSSTTMPESSSTSNNLASSSDDDDEAARRFREQLSGSWNQQVLENETALDSPQDFILERLNLLEQEKRAAEERLEEEFRLRAELDDKFYRRKRTLLEQAAADLEQQSKTASNNNTTILHENNSAPTDAPGSKAPVAASASPKAQASDT